MEEKTIGAVVRLPAALHARLKVIAARRGQTLAAVILDLLTRAARGQR